MAANCDVVTADLSNLVIQMMAKKRDQRPLDMHAFLAAFDKMRPYKR